MSLARPVDLPPHGTGLGLHRVVALTTPILRGAWGRRLDTIKVAGSNGKGSVATMAAAILQASGVVSGLFTSPHVHTPSERIRIDGTSLADADFDDVHGWCAARWQRYVSVHSDESLGAFDLWSAMALRAFEQHGVEAVVAEVGIGGRYDPVRLFPGGWAALVSVDLEHRELLGETIEQIACDKADIAAPSVPLLVGPVPGSVRTALEGHTRRRGTNVWFLSDHVAIRSDQPTVTGSTITLEVEGRSYGPLFMAAHGLHQVTNAALAITLARRWWARHCPALNDAQQRTAIKKGLASLLLPGRFQRVSQRPDVVVDVAHTPAATTALAQTLVRHLGPRRVVLVAGVSQDKDAEALLAPLLARASQVIATRARHRGAAPRVVTDVVGRRRPDLTCSEYESLDVAVAHAVARARREGRIVVVAGGFFLAVEAAAGLRKSPATP